MVSSGSEILLIVRSGIEADASEAVKVLRRSITELCVEDHQNNEEAVADWLSNKTEANWIRWLQFHEVSTFVVENHDKIVGVGMVDDHGKVLLNYVNPDFRFKGVSTTLLTALEAKVRLSGRKFVSLESSKTAKRFYESRGYRQIKGFSLAMQKRL